jgi:hypothetical protein
MRNPHVPLRDLIAAADGELGDRRVFEVRAHLASCWSCRARMREIEGATAEFVRLHQDTTLLPPPGAARALFRARLAELAAAPPPPQNWRERLGDFFLPANRLALLGTSMAAITAVLFAIGVGQVTRQQFRLTPDPAITPGAARPVTVAELCASTERQPRVIPAAVGRRVFDRYGIERPRAGEYELDYLISPELGGADDPKNFWPQPYRVAQWNAHVKDALEDHLHRLVCADQLPLETAQRELAQDWIAAYKKYFATEQPIASHRAFLKDAPWEP